MTSAAHSTPSPNAEQSAGRSVNMAGLPDVWQLSALTRSACLRPGSGVSVLARLAFDRVLLAVGEALERALERPVAIEIPGGGIKAPAGAPAFGVTFSYTASAGRVEAMIAVDVPMARALVDGLETDFANVRGSGNLTEAETGLLEYVTLACVDQVMRGSMSTTAARDSASADGRTFSLEKFLRAQEVVEWVGRTRVAPVALSGRVAGQGGSARLYLPGWEAGDVTAPVWDAAAAPDLGMILTVRLALPSVRLPAVEGPALQPGDVVLLGVTDLAAVPGCRLITAEGWELSTATVVRDSADVVSVRCGAFDARVWDAASAAEGDTLLGPTLGAQFLSLEQVAHWPVGALLDLSKDLQSMVDLWRGGAVAARGELIRIDGELGVRVTDVDPAILG